MPDLDDLADALYAAPPAGFVAARDSAAASARASGDRLTASAIAALRRPSTGAWLINLLAIDRPDLVADFVALAAPLREAQESLRGDELRTLSARRRTAVAALVDEARALATAADPGLTKPPLAEVEATLSAALASDEIAAAVSSGRLVRTVSYAGFGEPPAPDVAGVGPARRAAGPRGADLDTPTHHGRGTAGGAAGPRGADLDTPTHHGRGATAAERAARKQALADARAAEAEARAALDAANAAERAASTALADAVDAVVLDEQALGRLDEAVADAERRLAELTGELDSLRAEAAAQRAGQDATAAAREAAQRALDACRDDTHEAQERLFAARRRLADAGG